MDWGRALQEARDRKLMSQEHLAAASGVSVRTVRRAEKGGRVSGESLRCLCAALELRVGDGDDAPPQLVAEDLPREFVDAALTEREARVARIASYVPYLTAAAAALLVLTGAWPGAGAGALGFLALPLVLLRCMPMVTRRIDAISATLLTGFGFVMLSVMWLIHFGAGSPAALPAVLLVQMLAGSASMLVAITARNREWRERLGGDA